MTDRNRFGRTPEETEALRARVEEMRARYEAGGLTDKSADLEAKIKEQRQSLRPAR